jgi:uncharacterized membrane protein (TIGR02234 family)
VTVLPPPRTEQQSADPASADPGAADPASADPGAAAAPVVAPGAGAKSRRSLALMLLLAVLGAAVVLLAVGQTWARGSVDVQGTGIGVSTSGSGITGLPGALALVGLAASVAVFAVRGLGRVAVGLLLALAGAGAAVSALLAVGDTAALDRNAARAAGLTRATATAVGHTGWPWVAALGGVLLLLAGLLVLARGRDWPGMSSRYEAPGAGPKRPGRPAPATETPADLWKALDRGEDPTD